MRQLYTALFCLALPFILLRLLWKSRKNPAYRSRLSERFGCINIPVTANSLWVHAVSVGEVIAAVPLINQFQAQHPDIAVVVTTNTPTGADRVAAAFGNSVTHLYIPYDLPSIWRRFFAAVKPRCLVIMETELWPNLLHVCGERQLPVLLANARLSEKSANGYRQVSLLTREMLRHITIIAAQTEADAKRFFLLGCDPAKIKVIGSVKFDLEIPADLIARAAELRQSWGSNRSVWIAASTHEGEEAEILKAYAEVREKLPKSLLVLVPRHPERFSRVATLCKEADYNIILRSENCPAAADTHVIIGDSMGELLLFYAASDVAFVGGSLVATGGHNPLEPAALGLPIIMGPHLFNFAAISEQLLASDAMRKVKGVEELASEVLDLLQDKNKCQIMGAEGKAFVARNRGALARHMALVESMI